MSDGTITTTFRCLSCNNPTELSLPEDYTDDSIAKCKHCGNEFGRLGDIKEAARRGSVEKAQELIRDTFSGLKGWNVTKGERS